MCLITINTPETKFSKAWLLDFYGYNQDGLGVMYAQDGELFIEKFVPNTEKEVLDFYKHVHGKHAVVHWRMKTHGKIDEANAHPYEVLNRETHGIDLWMVHNGVLQGVANDQPHMSDTWHFIRDTIRPLLASFPDLLRSSEFVKLLEERIGSSNKLVFLDNWGNTTVINEKAFTEFAGAKLSNTYAWSSHSRNNLKSPLPKPVVNSVKGYYDYWGKTKYPAPSYYKPSTFVALKEEEDDGLEWEDEIDEDLMDMEEICYQHPETVAAFLLDFGIIADDLNKYKRELYAI